MLLYELLGFYVLFNVLICFFPSPPPFVVFHLHSCNSYDNTARASFPTLSYRFVVGQELLGGIEYYQKKKSMFLCVLRFALTGA